MALEILWTKQADRKFDKIIDYLFHEWNQKVTQAFVKKVYDTLDILAGFPEIGTIELKKRIANSE
ncbi:MAG: type II toxin-antitoxin system RelE/ParE family toxin [Bacteroidales bacterium]|nr:type II toxin-antitoxin system RelE/ParE family toxin [Bacteroidales bacterium]